MSVNGGAESCPVCPFDRLTGDMLACPACATDLTALRRVQELPVLLLNDAIGHARARDFARAVAGLSAAARFPRARGRALLLLGKCEAHRGDSAAAAGHWDEATAAGEASAAQECLEALAAMPPPPVQRWWRPRPPLTILWEPDGEGPEAAPGPAKEAGRGVDALRNGGAVLRVAALPEHVESQPTGNDTMIVNMGPQHPSTHGVLRVMMELEGETVLRSKPVIGYLHTGMEKTGEELTYLQGTTNVTRMDYTAPLFNELAFSLAVEALLEVEVPPRATWARMMMCELNRMASHCLWLGTNGMDLGAVSMMIYGFRERESILDFFEKCSGLRMNNNYIRPGGLAADLPPGWQDDVASILDTIPSRLDEYETLLTGQPIWQGRTQDVGVITFEECVALGVTGPLLRSTGAAWDLRRHLPYLHYDQVDFDVVVGTCGDSFDRYAIRLNEIRESARIVRQCIERTPAGDYRVQDKKVTPPPRARIDESMEALIHHFKLFTEGFRVPEGEVYMAVESPRGELGCYLVSDGSAKPYRLHIRAPSFVNLQAFPHMVQGGLVADAVTVISTIDPVMGEVDR